MNMSLRQKKKLNKFNLREAFNRSPMQIMIEKREKESILSQEMSLGMQIPERFDNTKTRSSVKMAYPFNQVYRREPSPTIIRRSKKLSSLIEEYCLNKLGNGEIGSEIQEFNLQISNIRIKNDLKMITIKWIPKCPFEYRYAIDFDILDEEQLQIFSDLQKLLETDLEIEKHLPKIGAEIRFFLSKDGIMNGSVPPVIFEHDWINGHSISNQERNENTVLKELSLTKNIYEEYCQSVVMKNIQLSRQFYLRLEMNDLLNKEYDHEADQKLLGWNDHNSLATPQINREKMLKMIQQK
ncbi:hypothetical protein SNEBB_002797 [Seison nebaliae]|nr:hypothetical protein SNEBB_002797 [Seison nebaliae]